MPKIISNDLKISVINFYNSEFFNINNLFLIFNISKSSLYNWLNNDIKPLSNIRSKYKSYITDDIKNYIIIYVTKKCSFEMKNLRKSITKIFNVSVSKSSVYRILKENNITNKKINQKIIPKNTNLKNKTKIFLKNINQNPIHKIISIDESSFDTHMSSRYGWSKKGTSIKKRISIPKRKRKTLTLAVSNKKIIGYSLVDGSSNKIIFEKFMKEQVLPKVDNNIILMDNVSFHHSKSVVDCINSTSNKIIYNIPYNPDTNPVEFVFSIIKNFVRKKEPNTLTNLEKCIIKSFKLVSINKLTNIFNHSLSK